MTAWPSQRRRPHGRHPHALSRSGWHPHALDRSGRRPHGQCRSRLRRHRPVASAAVLLATVVVLLPVFLMLSMSLRSGGDIAAHPLGLPLHPAWHNYRTVWRTMNYQRGVANTLMITVATTALTVFTGALCAYALARHVRRWTKAVYRVFVVGLTVPVFVFLTPLYLLIRDMGLLDSYLSVILGYTALHLPFAVFYHTGVLRSMPQQIEEAAALDGCGPWQAFWRIVLPILRPATATASVFVILTVWNDIVLPLLFLTDDSKQTVTLSMYSFIGTFGFKATELFPAVVLATLPLLALFVAVQRHVVAALTSGVDKG